MRSNRPRALGTEITTFTPTGHQSEPGQHEVLVQNKAPLVCHVAHFSRPEGAYLHTATTYAHGKANRPDAKHLQNSPQEQSKMESLFTAQLKQSDL